MLLLTFYPESQTEFSAILCVNGGRRGHIKKGEWDEKDKFRDTCEFIRVILQTMATLL